MPLALRGEYRCAKSIAKAASDRNGLNTAETTNPLSILHASHRRTLTMLVNGVTAAQPLLTGSQPLLEDVLEPSALSAHVWALAVIAQYAKYVYYQYYSISSDDVPETLSNAHAYGFSSFPNTCSFMISLHFPLYRPFSLWPSLLRGLGINLTVADDDNSQNDDNIYESSSATLSTSSDQTNSSCVALAVSLPHAPLLSSLVAVQAIVHHWVPIVVTSAYNSDNTTTRFTSAPSLISSSLSSSSLPALCALSAAALSLPWYTAVTHKHAPVTHTEIRGRHTTVLAEITYSPAAHGDSARKNSAADEIPIPVFRSVYGSSPLPQLMQQTLYIALSHYARVLMIAASSAPAPMQLHWLCDEAAGQELSATMGKGNVKKIGENSSGDQEVLTIQEKVARGLFPNRNLHVLGGLPEVIHMLNSLSLAEQEAESQWQLLLNDDTSLDSDGTDAVQSDGCSNGCATLSDAVWAAVAAAESSTILSSADISVRALGCIRAIDALRASQAGARATASAGAGTAVMGGQDADGGAKGENNASAVAVDATAEETDSPREVMGYGEIRAPRLPFSMSVSLARDAFRKMWSELLAVATGVNGTDEHVADLDDEVRVDASRSIVWIQAAAREMNLDMGL